MKFLFLYTVNDYNLLCDSKYIVNCILANRRVLCKTGLDLPGNWYDNVLHSNL